MIWILHLQLPKNRYFSKLGSFEWDISNNENYEGNVTYEFAIAKQENMRETWLYQAILSEYEQKKKKKILGSLIRKNSIRIHTHY